jgi:hypothetical protein
MRNDKSRDENDAAQTMPGGGATCFPEASNEEASPKGFGGNVKPSTNKRQRVVKRPQKNRHRRPRCCSAHFAIHQAVSDVYTKQQTIS